MSIEIRRASERYATVAEGRTTFHSFSFGSHYDPSNLGFAAMTALNDENLPAGTGYPDHRHSDIEIVTWVLEGALRHTDGSGASRVLLPGDVQRTSAGSGIVHAEVADGDAPTRFLQTWLRPDEPGLAPSYAISPVGLGPELVEVVGPDRLGLGVSGARLYVASADIGELVLPDAAHLHVFLARGALRVGRDELHADDAVRMVGEGGRAINVTTAATLGIWAFGE